jgi:hypothetical protein
MEQLSDEKLARKATLCRELLVTVSKIDPGFSQFRGLTTWELFLARNEQKRRNKEITESGDKELKDLLLIIIICLQVENRITTPWKVSNLAKQILKQMDAELDITSKEVARLYASIMQPAKQENPRVFFDISADGEPLGRIIMELKADVVPRWVSILEYKIQRNNAFSFQNK